MVFLIDQRYDQFQSRPQRKYRKIPKRCNIILRKTLKWNRKSKSKFKKYKQFTWKLKIFLKWIIKREKKPTKIVIVIVIRIRIIIIRDIRYKWYINVIRIDGIVVFIIAQFFPSLTQVRRNRKNDQELALT